MPVEHLFITIHIISLSCHYLVLKYAHLTDATYQSKAQKREAVGGEMAYELEEIII